MTDSNSDRERIFTDIKAALDPLPEKTPYPEYNSIVAVSQSRLGEGKTKWNTFEKNWKAVNGLLVRNIEALKSALRSEAVRTGYCDPNLKDVIGCHLEEEFTVEYNFDRNNIELYDFGITRGVKAVAESGSILLSDKDTSNRLASITPWTHIAYLEEKDLIPSLDDMIHELPDDPYLILVTGASKTADVEGILIEGVHGPGKQIAYIND